MPQITGVTVRNTNTNVQWVTNNQATVMGNGVVACSADAQHQPPVGFLNNPAHNFVITGNDAASGMPYQSGNLHPNTGFSEPTRIYAFS